MTNALGVLVALWASFVAVMTPRGMTPDMPEFWLTPWLYGIPVILLAWPLYLQVFKRLPRAAWWTLSIIGVLLSPVPFAVLVVGSSAMRGDLLDGGQPLSYYLPWRSIFTYWYAVFGAVFGAWVGIARARAPAIP